MKRPHTLFFLSVPVVCLLMSLVLLISHRGMPIEARPAQLKRLEQGAQAMEQGGEILLLAREETPLLQTVQDALDEMRIGWTVSDRTGAEALGQVDTVLVCTDDLPALEGEEAVSLIRWVEQGGHLGILQSQSMDGWFRIASHKLGIMDSAAEYREYHALEASPGVFGVFEDQIMDEELSDFTLPVQLESDCRVLLQSADENKTPLMWCREIGKGRALVCNHSLIGGKDSRGQVAIALEQLEDVLVYPVINAGLVFIDDFPAPQPEGYDEFLQEQFGMNIQGFFRNHWWPDMKEAAREYGVRYTGVLVETYNKNMKPPFEPDSQDHSLLRYYASELYQSGGEVGLHGYNHQPLCLKGWQYADEDYETWESTEDMEGAVRELMRYGHSFLPNVTFTSYVPPSNYLSDEGQKVLVDTVKDLVAISGVYLPEDGVNARVQEYHESPDGTVPVPRITSGFSMGRYEKYVAAGELNLHGIFSHFIHPDDVLDEERGALLGWEKMFEDFCSMLEEVKAAYPALRWCTATEAAAAVQRYDRLRIEREKEGTTLKLTLTGFYDEAWLKLSCPHEVRVTGAEVYRAGSAQWLRATSDTVIVDWGDGA